MNAVEGVHPAVRDVENVERVRRERAVALAAIDAERGKTVGLRRDRTEVAGRATREDHRAERLDDRRRAAHPHRQRRHRHRRVVVKELDERFVVGAAPRIDPSRDDVPRVVGRRVRRPCLAARVDRLACATERALHRRRARVEDGGALLCAEAKDVARDERRALLRRQELKRGEEREADALVFVVSRFGGLDFVHVDVRWARSDERVHVSQRRSLARGGRRSEVLGALAGRAILQSIEARARRDAIEPRAHARATIEPREPAPRAQQALLQQIVRVVDRPRHAIAVRPELPPVGRDRRRKIVFALRRLFGSDVVHTS